MYVKKLTLGNFYLYNIEEYGRRWIFRLVRPEGRAEKGKRCQPLGWWVGMVIGTYHSPLACSGLRKRGPRGTGKMRLKESCR